MSAEKLTGLLIANRGSNITQINESFHFLDSHMNQENKLSYEKIHVRFEKIRRFMNHG